MRTTLMVAAMVVVGATAAQTFTLKPVLTGFAAQSGFWVDHLLKLSDKAPKDVKKLPDGLKNAKFGEISIGGKVFDVLVGDLPGKLQQLFVDSNGDGDFTDDPAPKWDSHYDNQRDGTQRTIYQGTALFDYQFGGTNGPVSMVVTLDSQDPDRPNLKDTLMVHPDYGFKGEVQLGGKNYPVLLADADVTRSFQKVGNNRANMTLLIDRDNNGHFDDLGKQYDAAKPFNLDGTSYDIARLSPDGRSITLELSKSTVAEVTKPISFNVGSIFPGFKATTMDKNAVDFPSTYKGHIVLLDFWATWCGPCMGEVPNLTATYEKYHDKGFEILGVCLDQKGSAQKVIDTTKARNMSWPQIYDGGFWQAALAVKYGILAIPQAYLVDGDTGELLAEGDWIRGERLAKAVEEALTKKGLLKVKQR